MKKTSNKKKIYLKSKQFRENKRLKKIAVLKKLKKRKKNIREGSAYELERRKYILKKGQFKKHFYKKYKREHGDHSIKIDGHFGIERAEDIDSFMDKASEIIGSKKSHIDIDLIDYERVWPNAVTLLYSLKEWIDLTVSSGQDFKVSSTTPKSKTVDSYLQHNGMYEYVKRNTTSSIDTSEFKNDETIKIQQENKKYNIERRENEIIELLNSTSLSSDAVELFVDTVLTEVFRNLQEHGNSRYNSGWWILAQKHKTHGFVSLCFADNGIGIKNSLLTGPQKDDIIKKISPVTKNSGLFILEAMNENVSGASNASTKKGLLHKKHKKGSRRGHGLKMIQDTCKEIGIRFSIISQNGFLVYDNTGEVLSCGYRENKIFAGTIYHFIIEDRGK